MCRLPVHLDKLEFGLGFEWEVFLVESDEWLFVQTCVVQANMDWPFYPCNPISW